MRYDIIRIIAVAAALSVAGGGYASIPEYFCQEWQCGSLPIGWNAKGSGKNVIGATGDMLGGSDTWQIVEFPDGRTYAASGSTTFEGGRVNAVLTSPVVSIPESGAVLSFVAANYNPEASIDNKISIYAVDPSTGETGDEEIYFCRVKANNHAFPTKIVIPLVGLEGSETRFAFVNEGNGAGLLGIGTVKVMMYDASVSLTTPLFSSVPIPRNVSATVDICSPAQSFTATLHAQGKEESIIVQSPIEDGYSRYGIEFSTQLSPEMESSIPYSVSIRPDMPGSVAVTKNGTVACGEGFDNVIVEEEATGTRCGYCPLGSAELDYMSDMYPDRFIGIGIHCSELSTSVLQAPGYSDVFISDSRFQINSLPNAVINRRIMATPTNVREYEEVICSMLSERSVAKVDIDIVQCDVTTGEVKVDFSVTMGANLEGTDFRAAVVLTADDLSGLSPQWIQYNYYSGKNRPSDIGDGLWEYARFYYEYPSDKVSSSDRPLNHVAMGIYPDYHGGGCELSEFWTAYCPQKYSIDFMMPFQQVADGFGVQDPASTSVIILVINDGNGEIVTAQQVHASDFNRNLTEVKGLSTETVPSDSEGIFSLLGVKINPSYTDRGIYIRRQNGRTTKIIKTTNKHNL